MSLLRHATHRDKYEPEIVRAFRRGGATVQPLSIRDAPDLLVGYLGRTRLVECKTDNAQLRPEQADWHAWWRGEKPLVIRTAAHARKALRIWTLELTRLPPREEDHFDSPLAVTAGKNEDAPA